MGAISLERGVEKIKVYKDSVNICKFKEFIEELRAENYFLDICIFFDNLSVHRSKYTRERMDELSIAYVFNAPRSPEFNPIEICIGLAKRQIKAERFRSVIQNSKIDVKKLIIKSFENVDEIKVANCIKHSLKLLNKF